MTEALFYPIPLRPEFIDITPDMAAEWLRRVHPRNRRFEPTKVRSWIEILNSPDYEPTHQGIAFDTDGYLLDGQHRLRAIIELGRAVRFMVTGGLPSRTITKMDCGWTRKGSQFLKCQYANDVSAAIKYLQAVLTYFKTGDRIGDRGVYVRNLPPETEVAVFEQWPELEYFAPMVRRCYTSTGVGVGMHLAIVVQASRTRYADRLDSWFRGLDEGTGLETGDPRLALRKRYEGGKSKMLNNSCDRPKAYGTIAKAWNSYAVGEKLPKLSYGARDGIIRIVD